MSQFQLLRTARFWPFFWTQFLGAFNDNVFKNALIILVAYKSMSLAGIEAAQVVPLCAGIFILPFFLFSATAGQLADKFSKTTLIQLVKLFEILIMTLAAIGFLVGNLPLLLVVLFLMGLQSTFFGPAKYSILPELLSEDELVGGNALVEMGTFVSILLGTVVGGLLIAADDDGEALLYAIVILVACAGWLTSRSLKQTSPNCPDLCLSLNPITPTIETYRTTKKNRPVFLSVLGISWFWFFGASFLTLLPNYTKTVLLADEMVVTLLLALFCVGISIGSLLCERLSAGRLELGLVPLGSIGMTIFAMDLFFVGFPSNSIAAAGSLMGPREFLFASSSLRIVLDFTLLAVFSGLYTVPLYTMIQQHSEPENRSRVIAGNNILNALFMVASSLALMGLGALELTIPQIFLILSLLNAAAATYIYTVIPEFLLRFVVWCIATAMYKIKVVGQENIPSEGPAVLVCNHQSFVDWLILASAIRTPARFVMHYTYINMPVARFLFRDAKVIPIAPAREDKETLQAAFDKIAQELEAGELVCIFPEGRVTTDGKMGLFRNGIEKIIQRSPVPVVPISLDGMWGSIFSRASKSESRHRLKFFRSQIHLNIGEAVAPGKATANELKRLITALADRQRPGSRALNAEV